ncbi:hypothetical protein D3C86_1923560 [compost metagenome]
MRRSDLPAMRLGQSLKINDQINPVSSSSINWLKPPKASRAWFRSMSLAWAAVGRSVTRITPFWVST